jgi:hypothetical protein
MLNALGRSRASVKVQNGVHLSMQEESVCFIV